MEEEITGWVAVIGWTIATAATRVNPRTYAALMATTTVATITIVSVGHGMLAETNTRLAISETLRTLGYVFAIGAIIGTGVIGALRQHMLAEGYMPFVARVATGATALIALLGVCNWIAPDTPHRLNPNEGIWITASMLVAGTACWTIALMRERQRTD